MNQVIVVADDLIWMSRLAAAVERAGATAIRAASQEQLHAALTAAPDTPAVIDLNGRAYDGVATVEHAVAAGHRVIAVGQHEDLELRRRALAAGARRVYSYNKLFHDGPAVIAGVLAAETAG